MTAATTKDPTIRGSAGLHDAAGDEHGALGIVVVIPVGMSHVASVTLTAQAGRHVAEGEEFGYFQFGGSDIIIVFQPGVTPRIDTSTDYRLVGSPVAHVERWVADAAGRGWVRDPAWSRTHRRPRLHQEKTRR